MFGISYEVDRDRRGAGGGEVPQRPPLGRILMLQRECDVVAVVYAHLGQHTFCHVVKLVVKMLLGPPPQKVDDRDKLRTR
jgi:hypothetical protein